MSYIRVYLGKELKNKFELGESRVTIGRTENNVIVLPDEGVSRDHASIEYQDGEYFIVDHGSQNGVFLNNEKVERSKLKYWDEIQIHNFVIKFMASEGIGGSKQNDEQPANVADLESDKTKFFDISDKKQLTDLRNKTKKCYLVYTDQYGKRHQFLIKKPRLIIGKSKYADIRIKGWFAPSIAAKIERQGSGYELIPEKRGKVFYKNQAISLPTKLVDGDGFMVRDNYFKFLNRLTKSS